jgi:SpoVK/Ycf46/Vps4 family AAA+-type ATPase
VLHYLTGVNSLDERLQGLVHLVPPEAALACSQQAMAQKIAALWQKPVSSGRQPIILLCGPGGEDKRAVAAVSCAALELHMHAIRAADIPAAAADRETLARLWEREAILSNSALLIDAEYSEELELQRSLIPFLQTVHGFVLVSRRDPLQNSGLSFLRFDVNKPAVEEQKIIWQETLGPLARPMNSHLDRLVNQFSFGYQRIKAISATSANQAAGSEEKELPDRIWEICRDQSRPRLDDLAQRLEPRVAWDDLVLPREQLRMLKEIAAQVRHRDTVYHAWKFAEKETRGLGIGALFTGASGTGKTLAAEVLGGELQLDLYRIDLSQVVSKYIGETEKNLRRVFEAAEDGGAILLFDEADALFGKRSEVKDSHDRYANIELSYLLQRMETYRGLAILTSNMKDALDPAFLRRIRFIVQFPFPDINARAEIWKRVYPAGLPTQDLAIDKLARLSVTGGSIRNIALNAAFLAADAGEAVRMHHLLQAAQVEYSKLEKPLTEAEIRGWI